MNMSTVMMLFLFPIGIAFLIHELRDKKRYHFVFHDFFDEVQANPSYSKQEKIEHVQKMLLHNEYHIVFKDDAEIIGERKILSVGMLFISLGLFYVGLLFYLIYFFKFQKPHRVKFSA
ncbi:MAG: hypothetical protein OEW60_05455 [Thiovulaceae bacterium]|nr:hypothetical protein [Sulfurimonadaceae bacterium]